MQEKVTRSNSAFKLTVPITAKDVEEVKPDQNVKVLAVTSGGQRVSEIVKLDKNKNGEAVFSFKGNPGSVQLYLGPDSAPDEDLEGLQTITVAVSPQQLQDKDKKALSELKLQPVIISPYYWHWWWIWCRTFTIRGRVVCANGLPVAGARVCAADVNWWWWWSSRHTVGCDYTDANGAFEIKFKWCCGWWPWWWWRTRYWEFDPHIAERIYPVLHEHNIELGLPSTKPDFSMFEKILGKSEVSKLNIPTQNFLSEKSSAMKETEARTASANFDPGVLSKLGKSLQAKLPRIEEFVKYKMWPWYDWYPWNDCNPDIVFTITQDCNGTNHVIYNDTVFDARWNVPTLTTVTLIANDSACCIAHGDPDPVGYCAVITNVCNDQINNIGGNTGAPAAPLGFESPGGNDRPYGGLVTISGQIGTNVDYYELAYWNGAAFVPVPDVSKVQFQRDILKTVPAPPSVLPPINVLQNIGGKLVYETRHHYETTPAFGPNMFWFATNYTTLAVWDTTNPFLNGNYRLAIIGYNLVAGNLVNQQILPLCGTNSQDDLKLFINNRLTGAASGHPASTAAHPCGSGTVHTCTLEPDTSVLSVSIIDAANNVVNIQACDSHTLQPNDKVRIDFMVTDAKGFLDSFTLDATYGINHIVNLIPLSIPGATLTALNGIDKTGPTYAQAIAQGAARPHWNGGVFRFEADAHHVFPVTCCYQLELRAYNRTIVSCNYSDPYRNLTEYSFMITV